MRILSTYIMFLISLLIAQPVFAKSKTAGSLLIDSKTGLVVKVVAASNQINAYIKADRSSKVKYKLDLLSPYYVIEESGEFYKISNVSGSGAEGGDIGFVPKEQVHLWPTREALHFLPTITAEERNPLKAWDDEEKITKFFDTGDEVSYKHTYEEDLKSSLKREKNLRPYPVLESKQIDVRGGRAKKNIYKVLVPTVITPEHSLEVKKDNIDKIKKTIRSVTFCIVFDATGSMSNFAKQTAEQLLAALESLGSEQDDIKIGYVFYRDAGDSEPSLIVPAQPIKEAAQFLNSYANKMSGGGDAAEPVLDALYIGSELFDWAAGDAQSGAKRVAIAVLNSDAKISTTGAIDSRVPSGLGAEDVAKLLLENTVVTFTIQAGPDAGGNLETVLRRVAQLTKGKYIDWGDGTIRNKVGIAIKDALTSKTSEAFIAARDIAASVLIKGDKAVIPMKIIDGTKLKRLREAGIKFNINDGKGGVLVEPGYIPENADLLDNQIKIEKDTLQKLLNLLTILASTSLDTKALRDAVQENIAAIAGEDVNLEEDIETILKKQFGINFRQGLLKVRVDYLDGLTPKEKLAYQKRIKEAADKLKDFLDAKTDEFDKIGTVWMPVGYLP